MIDPRKNKSQEGLDASSLRTAAMFSAVAYGTIRVAKSYIKAYDYAERAIEQARKTIESRGALKISPLFKDMDDFKFVTGVEPGDVSKIHDLYDPFLDDFTQPDYPEDYKFYSVEDDFKRMTDTIEKGSVDIDKRFDIMEPVDANDLNMQIRSLEDPEFKKLYEAEKEDLRISSFSDKVHEIGRGMDSRQWSDLEKRYPGIAAFVNDLKQHEVEVVDLKLGDAGHILKLKDKDMMKGGKLVEINLPDWANGRFRLEGADYRVLPQAIIPATIKDHLEAMTFGNEIMTKINGISESFIKGRSTDLTDASLASFNRELKKAFPGSTPILATSKAELVKSLFDRTISKQRFEYVGGQSELGTLLQQRFQIDEAKYIKQFTKRGIKDAGYLLQYLHGKEVRFLDGPGPNKGSTTITDLYKEEWRKYLDVPFISEQAALGVAKLSTASPLWKSQHPIYAKQSQQRIDFAHGVPISGLGGVKLTHAKILSALGPMETSVLDRIQKAHRHTMPGRVANAAFYFGDPDKSLTGELTIVGEGGHAFVVRDKKWAETIVKDATGKETNRFRHVNAADFNYSNPVTKRVQFSRIVNGQNVFEKSYNNIKKDINERLKSFNKTEEINRKLGSGTAVMLEAGTVIGIDIETKKEIRLDKDAFVTGIYENKETGIATIKYEEPTPMGEATKMVMGKTQEEIKIDPRALRGVETLEYMFPGREKKSYISQMLAGGRGGGYAENNAEFIMNADNLSKYRGGNIGLGMMEKTMLDVAYLYKNNKMGTYKRYVKIYGEENARWMINREAAKTLKGVANVLLGDKAVTQGIEKLYIDDDFGIGIELKKGIDTSNPKIFGQLMMPEELIISATKTNDWSKIAVWAEETTKKIHKATGVHNYRMMVTEGEKEYLEAMQKNEAVLPTFMMSKETSEATMMTLRVPMMLHSANVTSGARFAGATRSLSGYENGVKVTIDHMRNAQLMGLPHYTRYLQTLTGYNMTYIENKIASATNRLLTGTDINKATKDKGNLLYGKKSRLVSLRDKTGEMSELRKAMVIDYNARQMGSSHSRFLVAQNDVESLARFVDDDSIKDALMESGQLSTDSLITRGKLGLAGNSVGIISDDSMKALHESLSRKTADEVVFLKLPSEYDIMGDVGSKDINYVALHDFDKGDIYELMAMDNVVDQKKSRFFTGSKLFTGQANLIATVANVEAQLRDEKIGKTKRKELNASLDYAVKSYYRGINLAFYGKNAPARTRLIETGMPFSTFGQLRSMDETMVVGMKLGRGGDYAPKTHLFNYVGMHDDHIVRMLSQDRIDSYTSAKKLMRTADSYVDIKKRLRGLTDELKPVNEKIEADFISRLEDLEKTVATHGTDGDVVRILNETKRSIKYQQIPDRKQLRAAVKESIGSAIVKISNNEELAYLGKTISTALDRVEEGKMDILVRVQGYPESSELSGGFGKLVRVKPGTSKETAEELGKRVSKQTGMKIEFSTTPERGHIYLSKMFATFLGRDFDQDPISLSLAAYEALDNVARDVNAPKTLSEMVNLNSTVTHGMGADAVSAMIESRLVVEVEDPSTGGIKKTLYPANASALSAAKVLDDFNYERYIHFNTNVAEELRDGLARAGVTMSKGEMDKFVSGRVSDWEKKAKWAIKDKTGSVMKIATGLTNAEIASDAKTGKVAPHKVAPEVSLIDKNPSRFFDAVIGRTPDEQKVYETYTDYIKRDMAAYEGKRSREVGRFLSRKVDTAKSYKIAEALFYLNETYGEKDEGFRVFMRAFADKATLQHSLSQKHGTPLIMNDLLDRINVMLDPSSSESYKYLKNHYELDGTKLVRGLIPDKFFQDIAEGNIQTAALHLDVDEMDKYGFLAKEVKEGKREPYIREYSQYTRQKAEYLQALSDIHQEVADEAINEKNWKLKSKRDVRAKQKGLITAKLESFRQSKSGAKFRDNRFLAQDINDELLDPAIFNRELTNTLDTLKNIGYRGKDPSTGYMVDYISKYFKVGERIDRLRQITKYGQLYTEVHGESVIQNTASRAIRDYTAHLTEIGDKGVTNTLYTRILELKDKMTEKKLRGTAIPIEHLADRVLATAINTIYKLDTSIKVRAYGARKDSLSKIIERERINFARQERAKLAGAGTVYKQGSISKTLSGKMNRVVAGATDDAFLRKMGKSRVGAVLAGLFLGVVAGQSYNQMTAGYAVPDLKNVKGLGGEYYENVSGIMNREMEIMMSPRPPKVVPWYNKDHNANVHALNIDNINEAGTWGGSPIKHKSTFKGVVVS